MFIVRGHGSQRSRAHALFQQPLSMKFCMGLVDSGRRHLPFCWTAGNQDSVVKACVLRYQGLGSGTLSPGAQKLGLNPLSISGGYEGSF